MSPLDLDTLPPRVRVVEVGPRDGLQNQPVELPVEVRVEWIERLEAAGVSEIEVTSFVHPKWVPQLADAEELVRRLPPPRETVRWALVPNVRGLERALSVGVRCFSLFTAATETFCRRNTNCSIDESLGRIRSVLDRLAEIPAPQRAEHRLRGYISTCFGCPYEGSVDPERVATIARELHDMGIGEIVLSDTIGVATPPMVVERVERVAVAMPRSAIALHFHDTRGMALANVLTALGLGIATFDSSSGGLGGCPYAPGAAGNLATEDLVMLLESLGAATGIDLETLVECNLWFEHHFPTRFPGRVLASYRSQRPSSEK